MKTLKVTISRAAKTREFDALPEKEKTMQRFRRQREIACPCCGDTMLLESGVWRCCLCSYCITQKEMLDDATFWFCDGCGRFLNVQPGFTEKTGAWKCISCGWTNDVSEENIQD